MTPALQEITIYRPDYAMVIGKGMTRVPYVNPESSSGDFQVTDSCERSAAVMGDDYVKLSFELLHQQVFEAFSFIWYDNQLFFLKETYRPTSKGAYFKYDMKFVSIANMLDKQVCFRYITVSGQSIQPEPEINMNGTLDDMASIVVDSIHGAAERLMGTSRTQLYYAYVLQRLTLADDTLQGTTLQTFSFSGQKIAETLTEIANAYETEWWISQEDIQTVKLHMCKCECGDTIVVSDEYKVNGNEYESRGLLSCEYTQEWGNIPQKIIAFGSDRNLTRNQALQDVNGNQMYVSYGKQLRLAPNTSYTVKDRNGKYVAVKTDGIGALTNTGVTSGIESVVVRDDIYPRCHFRVLGVTVKGTDNPIFTITAGALKADGVTVMSYAEMVAEQLLPLQIAPNETLSISFESGYLNGKEFEVAYDYKEVNGVMEWALTIVPEQGDDNGVSLPFGNLAPKVGDQFAIFHMIMPQFYITRAQEELAQVAYDEMLGVQDTRPEIKCKSEPEFFANQRVILGQRMGVHSELFGNILLDTNGDIAEGSPSLFVSRVTQFTHSLTTPNDVELRLASSRVEGHLSEIEATIADQTDDIRGLEQRTINLSRRGWHDAAEMRDMLNSLAAEFLLIGEQKNQFAFTSAIECVNGYIVADIDHFDHLHVSAGYIQHTQEPYIKYGNSGRWDINVTDITTDENSNSLDPTKAYYLYAICAAGTTTATIVLTDDTTKASNTDYLLMGILSSEYEDENTKTSYRVFNRSNGFTRVAGGTITTEQIQDPTRSLIIDFSSNPPRIIARNNAEIVGNINFKLTPQQISDIVASMPPAEAIGEIGGENLFRAEDWADWKFRPSSFAHKLRSDDLQAGKYVMTGKVYSTYSGCKVLAQYSDGTTKVMFSDSSKSHLSTSATEDNLVTTGVGITLDLSFEMEKSGYVTIIPTSPSKSNYYRIALVEVMLQKGDRATAYQPWVNYLTKALQGQTSVAGGLLATSVILLRDGDEVTAGMSGVKDDNILVFGGGSYDEAVNAAASPTYDKGDGTPITSLLKKDGQGKLGVFKVEKDNAQVNTKDGTIVIDDTDGLSCKIGTQELPVVLVTPKELKSIDTLRSEGAPKSGGGRVEAVFEDISDMIYTSGESILYSPTITRRFFVGAGGTIKVSGQVMTAEVILSHPTNASVGDQDRDGIYCNVFDDEGNRIASGFASQDARAVFKCTVDKAGYYALTMSAGVFVDVTSVDIDDAGHGLSVTIKFLDYVVGMENEPATYADYSYTYTEANRQTVMAYKGLFSYQGETAYLYYKDGVGFECRMGGVIFKISDKGVAIDGLPSRSTGLSTGQLYDNGDGILRVKH